MNLIKILEDSKDFLGLIFLLAFLGLMAVAWVAGRERPGRGLREIAAYTKLRRAVGLAVEAGTRVHVAIGSGSLRDLQGGSTLVGLSMLERIARAASISDSPPVATSGDGVVAILTQDTLHSAYQAMGIESRYDPSTGRFTGPTPFSYAAGAMPVSHDEQVSVNVLVGHFGSEIALLTDAGERSNTLTVAGSDQIPAQAVLYATAQEPLIGEELYSGGAYLNAGPWHFASLNAQDVTRWALAGIILVGAILKLFGFL